jgi:hypothetical protein
MVFSRWTLKRHRYKRPRDLLGMSPIDIIRINVNDVPEHILKHNMTGLNVEQRRALAALIDIKRYVKKLRKQKHKYPIEYIGKEVDRYVSWYIRQYRDRFPDDTSTPNMLRSSVAGINSMRSMVNAASISSGMDRLRSYASSRVKGGGLIWTSMGDMDEREGVMHGGGRKRSRTSKLRLHNMIGCRRVGRNRTRRNNIKNV